MKTLLKDMLRPLYYWLSSGAYRIFSSLVSSPIRPGRVSFQGARVQYVHPLSTAWQVREIFFDEIYDFKTDNTQPVIIDCGANIGLASLFFLRRFPDARLTVIEANPEVAEVLAKNISEWTKKPVRIIAAAAWVDNAGVELSMGASDDSAIGGDGPLVRVPSVRLKTVLQEHEKVDFLKMDIEGAEYTVLSDCRSELAKVQHLFVEYHSANRGEQNLGELLLMLKSFGFHYYTETLGKRRRPFLAQASNGLFNLQVNVFAWKN